MWWIETTGYHLAGLVWLIVIAIIFVIAVVALSTAGAAISSARRTRRMVRDHEADHFTSGPPVTIGAPEVSESAMLPDESRAASMVEREPPVSEMPVSEMPVSETSLGDSMRILHERYARGEITREEYLRAREDMMAITPR